MEDEREYRRANAESELHEFAFNFRGTTVRGNGRACASNAEKLSAEEADALVFEEMLNTTNETFYGGGVSNTVAVVEESTPEETAIREFEAREVAEMAALEADTASAIVNGSNKPVWYAECARRALDALTIDNVVVVAYVDEPLQCANIVARAAHYGLKLNSSSYAAMIHRQLNPRVGGLSSNRAEPTTTTAATATTQTPIGARQSNQISATSLVFPTGKLTTTGTRNFATGVWATRCSVDIIRQTCDDNGVPLYPELRIRRIGIKNVVASTVLFFEIDIKALSAAHPKFIHDIESFWVGVVIQLSAMGIAEYENRTATLLVYESGSMVFTSMRGRADVVRVFRFIWPLLVPFAKPGTARWQTPLLLQNASKSDGTASKQSTLTSDEPAAATPSLQPAQLLITDAETLEHSSLLVQNGGGVGSALALRDGDASRNDAQMSKLQHASNKRKNQSEVAVARNYVALDTMDEHVAKKVALEHERAAVLASLRATKTTPARRAPIMHTKLLDAADAMEMINEQVNEQ
jgi:TATA-box binding protein (TBP) (component of TFIID and TFIIIB)